MSLKKLLIGSAIALAMTSAANANVVFESGTDGDFWSANNPFVYTVITQEFTLNSAASFNSFTYNAFTNSDTVPVTNVYLEFRDSSNALLFSGDFNVANSNVIGTDGSYNLTDYTVNLPTQNFAAGTYTFGIQVSPDQWDMHWSIPNNPTVPDASDGFAHYFRLESTAAVAEPASWAMMIGGFALAGAAMRRRQAASVRFA